MSLLKGIVRAKEQQNVAGKRLLLGASVRKNLDPFDEHSLDALKTALVAVGLSPRLLDSNGTKGESDHKR